MTAMALQFFCSRIPQYGVYARDSTLPVLIPEELPDAARASERL